MTCSRKTVTRGRPCNTQYTANVLEVSLSTLRYVSLDLYLVVSLPLGEETVVGRHAVSQTVSLSNDITSTSVLPLQWQFKLGP